ncbi:GCN5 family acetyltransferase [Nocardioides sp. Root1257]|uniref:GNAT family N-acetyltransferase n=1 Tax=unclassified Nocardioides TaxID=2615069 RepID=UPI00070179A2|nr:MULTISPECIES: GNAT family N-acetyltransferase [unclassified Nocardioides]KQW47713.1 GCN5 family acetyltransferase [Nocardioides sp. Root1257]KRC44965.1 GCN5 family acetyltransferase [Nocardioides sp. Root224]
MSDEIALPDGLSGRPLVMSDSAAVVEVMAAQELHDTGEVAIEEADIISDWQRPSYDVSAGTLGVFDGDRLVAYAEHMGADRGDAAVHPDHRGRGIGTALAAWMQDRARAAGASEVGMPVPRGSAGDRLLEALGYRVRWESWVLQLPEGTTVPERALPPGYSIREATPDDYAACWTVLEDAFLEWSVREREPFDDFLARTVQRPGFESWNLRLVVDADGEAVGATTVYPYGTEGYIDRLATRKDQRGQGIAQAMLVDAFAVAREHGATTSGLNTDSRTGALGLYEKVGMHVTQTWVNRAIAL